MRGKKYLALLGLAACSVGKPTPENLISKKLEPLRSSTFEDNHTLSTSALKLNISHQFLLYQVMKMNGDEAATVILENSAVQDPASAHLQMLLSREAFRLGDFEAAEQRIHQAFTLDPKNSEVHREYANVLATREKFPEAYVHIEKLLDETPADEELLNLAISIDVRRDDYWVALKRLERALKDSASPEFVYYKMGRVYRDMGKNKEAREAFEKSLAIDSNYYQAATYLAILCEEQGDEVRALELYEGLAHLTNNALYHRKLASLFMKRKDFSKAIEAFHNLLQLEPSDMNSLLQMARAWIEVGDLAKSEEKFRELLAMDPGNGTLRLMLGMLLEAQTRFPEALDQYLLIESDSTAYFDSMPLRLKAFHKLDRKKELLESLEASSTLAQKAEDANKSQALFRVVAQYFAELQELSRSEEVLKSALKRFPSDEALLFQKGMLFEKMRRYDDSIKIMLSILSVNPAHVGALNYVGYTWAEQGKNLDEAEKFVKKALEFEPGDPFITDSLAWVYYQKGRYQEAYDTLTPAHAKVPTEFVIVEHLGDILVKLGRLSEARDYYAKALRLKPDHLDMLAKVQTKLQQVDARLPPDARMGRLDDLCTGLINPRCNASRMHFDADSQRTPASTPHSDP